ncbi:MAG: hypothetical protein M1817_000782 [Caeruleum heppii]|nr:MAG: hypothetical protein M1817_000782 [Caeruleum heppii]
MAHYSSNPYGVPFVTDSRPSPGYPFAYSQGPITAAPPGPMDYQGDYFHPAPPLHPMASRHNVNAFQQNAAYPGFPGHSYNNTIPSASHPAFPPFGQLPSGHLPPPPFPPVPIPQHGFSPHPAQQPGALAYNAAAVPPPPPILPAAPGTLAQATVSIPSKASGPASPNPAEIAPVEADMPSPRVPEEDIMDREEGELSEAEAPETSNSSSSPRKHQSLETVHHYATRDGELNGGRESIAGQNYSPNMPLSPSPSYDQHRGSDHNMSQRRPNKRKPSPYFNQTPRESDNRFNSKRGNARSSTARFRRSYDQYVPSYSPREPSPPDALSGVPTSKVPSQSLRDPRNMARPQGVHLLEAEPNTHTRSPVYGKAPEEIRKLAKNAILNLLPYQVRFEDFVAEGVNPNVLRDLFSELRLRCPDEAWLRPASSETASEQLQLQPQSQPQPQLQQQRLLSSGRADGIEAGQRPSETGKAHVNGDTPVNFDEQTATSDAHLKVPPTSTLVTSDPALNWMHLISSQPPPDSHGVTSNQPAAIQLAGNTLEKAFSPPNKPELEQNLSAVARPQIMKATPNTSGKSQTAKTPGIAGKLERKDLIAQKLAARSSNTISSAADPKGNVGSLGSSSAQNAAEDASGQTTATHLAPSLASDHQSAGRSVANNGVLAQPTMNNVSQDEMDAKARQTELVRQRMALLQGTDPSRPNSAAAGLIKPTELPLAPPVSKDPAPDSRPPKPTASVLHPEAGLAVAPSFSGIPGLFMSSSPAVDIASSATQPDLSTRATVNRRKRPVAADFDDEAASTIIPHKRPFGHVRAERSVVIDVSEDELSDASDAEIGQLAVTKMQVGQQQATAEVDETARRAAIRDMPPLPDLPVRRKPLSTVNGSGRSSTPQTPPPSQAGGKGNARAQEDLRRKEEQIEAVKRRIAEIEQRKAKLKEQETRSQAGPTSESAPPPIAAATMPDSPNRSSEVGIQLTDDALPAAAFGTSGSLASPLPISRTLDAQSLARAAEVRRRRAELEAFVLESEAELKKEAHRLEELQREREAREIAMQQALQTKLRLIKELEGLGAEALHASIDQLEAQKPEILQAHRPVPEDARDLAGDTQVDKLASTTFSHGSHIEERIPADAMHDDVTLAEVHELGATDASSPSVKQSREVSDESTTERRGETTSDADFLDAGAEFLSAPQQMGAATSSSASPSPSSAPLPTVPPPQASDSLQHQDQAFRHREMMLVEARSETDQDMDTEESVGVNVASGKDGSEREEGEMSEDSEGAHDSDPYEPPEVASPVISVNDERPSPPFSPAAAQQSRSVSVPGSFVDRPEALVAETKQTVTADTDSSISQQLQIPPKEIVQSEQSIKSPQSASHYTPYESPLKRFRSYRYHPLFLQEVTGGFRSLTFSHRINQDRPVCHYETSGGICNDHSCEGQHFRDMVISDDMILVQLGSINEGESDAEKEEYVTGLKHTLHQLRTSKVKDFATVASNISAYRTRFLKDSSRVLSLDSRSRI